MARHDSRLLQKLEEQRAERFAARLTRAQLEAIANDTRLPGEIAGAFGVSASIIIRIQQQRAKEARRLKKAAARHHAPKGNAWQS